MKINILFEGTLIIYTTYKLYSQDIIDYAPMIPCLTTNMLSIGVWQTIFYIILSLRSPCEGNVCTACGFRVAVASLHSISQHTIIVWPAAIYDYSLQQCLNCWYHFDRFLWAIGNKILQCRGLEVRVIFFDTLSSLAFGCVVSSEFKYMEIKKQVDGMYKEWFERRLWCDYVR